MPQQNNKQKQQQVYYLTGYNVNTEVNRFGRKIAQYIYICKLTGESNLGNFWTTDSGLVLKF